MINENSSLVSIITPTFNSGRFISETIRSVQSQTYGQWEMIIVDDCSKDNTCEIVKQKAKSDKRINLIQLSTNSGPAIARNVALQNARGRYIAFLDSDDLWLPQKLELQVSVMQCKDIVFSYTQYRHMSESGDSIGKLIESPEYIDYHGLLKNTKIGCLTVMIDQKKTGPLQMMNIHHEDFALWLSLLKRGFIAYGLQQDLARYRIMKSSISGRKLKAAAWVWNIYRRVEKLSLPYAAWCFMNYSWNAYRKSKSCS